MKHLLALLAISSIAFTSCNKKESASADTAKADSAQITAKNNFEAVYASFNSGKLDDLDKYIAADYIEHSPDPGQEPGLAGLKKQMTMFRTAFPDVHFSSEKVIANGDMACDVFHLTGTNTGSMMPGMPPTGKKMDIMGADIVRIDPKTGKGVEHWAFYEEGKMMKQLGMMPDMPPSADKANMDMKKGK